MRKNVVRRMAPAYQITTLAFCLLGSSLGTLTAFSTEPVLPDVNLPDAPVQATNPVSELPPPPSPADVATPTIATTAASSVITKASKPATSPSVVQQSATAPMSAAPGASKAPPHPKAWKGESLRALAKRLNLALPLQKGRIVVSKSQRRLDLYQGDVLLKSYRVSLGSNPVGHKKRQGDGRTPEGQFYICTRNDKTSAFHIFLGLSYPALPDATRAVQNKAISPREFQIIRQRLASRGAPLWETRLGGWVGIHGGTDGSYAQRTIKTRKSRDWTAGCVAVTNREIDELYTATRIGTPVLVQP